MGGFYVIEGTSQEAVTHDLFILTYGVVLEGPSGNYNVMILFVYF